MPTSSIAASPQLQWGSGNSVLGPNGAQLSPLAAFDSRRTPVRPAEIARYRSNTFFSFQSQRRADRASRKCGEHLPSLEQTHPVMPDNTGICESSSSARPPSA